MIRSIQDEYSNIKIRTSNIEDQLSYMKNTMPQKLWMMYNIYKKISTMTSNLMTIRKMCLVRKAATKELGELFESKEISQLSPHDTYLDGLDIDSQNYHLSLTFVHTRGATELTPKSETRMKVDIESLTLWKLLFVILAIVLGIITLGFGYYYIMKDEPVYSKADVQEPMASTSRPIPWKQRNVGRTNLGDL